MKVTTFRFLNRFIKILPTSIRTRFYIWNGLSLGMGSDIAPDCMIDSPRQICVGDNSHINRFCEFHTGISKNAYVNIESNTWIGCNVKFICITHEMGGGFSKSR